MERRPGLARGLGLAVAAGLGVLTALVASGTVPMPRTDTDDAGTDDGGAGAATRAEPQHASAPVAVALGLGTFTVVAGVSEVGLRGQRRLERWAGRVNGHPRVTIGLLSAALSLAIDVAEGAAGRR